MVQLVLRESLLFLLMQADKNPESSSGLNPFGSLFASVRGKKDRREGAAKSIQ
jgi:hypothetical protein